jgi:uncharacterized protein with PQ loop repeat
MDYVAYTATCLGVIKVLPQISKIHSDDNVSSFSREALMIGVVATILWIIYGVAINSKPIIMAYSLALIVELWILFKILKSEKYKKQ